MPLDVDNPWEAHAYFVLGFSCDDCHKHFEFESPHEACSDEWCVTIARAAFDAGWFVPHPLPDGRMDFETAWCPLCGQQRRLTQPKYDRYDHAA